MSNELQSAFKEITDIRALPSDIVLEALQSALVSAYRKDTGASTAQAIEAEIDPDTGRQKVLVEKEVVDEVLNDATEVTLERARFFEPEAQIHDVVMVQVIADRLQLQVRCPCRLSLLNAAKRVRCRRALAD